ncbi:hypothetical protein CYY_006864 [Polysphondylium violaceum]|uniref:Trafficking protein particle complex subunit 10 n=1 Tax=Polysphondylium violaceum TaxID=133409 RepID=A0A8J4PRA2_9MYCE|nr:hypothetical protein CYY_006864 [Polysphondylium violaceum]
MSKDSNRPLDSSGGGSGGGGLLSGGLLNKLTNSGGNSNSSSSSSIFNTLLSASSLLSPSSSNSSSSSSISPSNNTAISNLAAAQQSSVSNKASSDSAIVEEQDPTSMNSSSSNVVGNDTEHITISYQDDPGVWKYLEADLSNHLPLKNISWKTKTGHTKVVEKMPIDILHYNNERVKSTFNYQNLYKKPYLYLYLVHCDEPDTYKNVIRTKIKNWVAQMTEKQQEWLIVYVSLGPKRSEIASKLTRTVYDRIKNDFNVKRDRCCQLRFLDDNNKNNDLWDDFLIKMKEGIISSAEQYLTIYEEEIRKMDSRRFLPGWSYLDFFFLKESLALIYERAQLYEDALMQYLELEVLFTENKSNFENISGGNCLENTSVLTYSNNKPYRDLIFQNKISLFDFKHYLFSRQTKLLFLLQRPFDVATKAINFITSISIIIKKNPESFKPLFREAWIYCASMEIIKACQDSFDKMFANNSTPSTGTGVLKAKTPTPPLSRLLGALGTGFGTKSGTNSVAIPSSSGSGNTLSTPVQGLSGSQSLTNLQSAQLSGGVGSWVRAPSLNLTTDLERPVEKQDRESLDFLLSDMLFSAAQKLEEIAIQLKLIPGDTDHCFYKFVDTIFNDNDNNESTTTTTTNQLFSSPILQSAFESQKQFQQVYFEILGQAEKLYSQSNRMRSISRLTYCIANLHFKQKDFQIAEGLFKSISNLYFREGWSSIEYAIKTKLSYCQKQLGHTVDYVTTCVGLLSPGLLSNTQEKQYYLDEIIHYSNFPEYNIVQPMLPLFKCKVSFEKNVFRYLETIKINIKIKSNLISPLKFNSGSVSFIKSNPSTPSEKLVFSLNNFTINPGTNHLQFTAVGSHKASFVKDSIWLKLGSVQFGHSLRGEVDKGEISIIDSESQITLESFANGPLLLYSIQYIGIKLQTHSDTIEAGILSFVSKTGATIISTPSINIIHTASDGVVSLKKIDLVNEKLPLSHIGYNETLEFYIPIMAINNDACAHQFNIELQHLKQTKEKFSSSLLSTTLFINPFSIDYSVIPVNNRLFLKTIIQSSCPNMLQFNSYSLQGCDLEFNQNTSSSSNNSFYLIKDHNKSIQDMNLYPGQNLSLIFEIQKYNINDPNKEVSLGIKYTNKLQDTEMVKECKSLWKDQNEYLIPITLEIPLFLYSIDLYIEPKSYLGVLVPFQITITNLKSTDQNQPTTLNNIQYQIEIDPSVWMVSGKNKHSFYLENGATQTFSCHLLPISTGSLPTPKVSLSGINPSNIKYPKRLNEQIFIFSSPEIYSCQIDQPSTPSSPTPTTNNTTKPK